MVYTNWNPGEPNFISDEEYCMFVTRSRNHPYCHDGKWQDLRCYDPLCYICEVNI